MPGDSLPRLGLGTYSDANRHEWRERVETALEAGYRHVDTAEIYGNEKYVGEGLADADVDREDVFLATKTAHVDVPPDPEQIPARIDARLDRLGVDYVDLLYVHWPSGIYDHEDVLPHFDAAYEDGKIRNVGLSNFTPDLLDEAREVLDAPVFAHQVEIHPFCPQEELVAYAQRHDHWLVAYSPLAKGTVFDDPVIQEVAEKHDASPARVSLAWLLSKDNVAAIPKASSHEHMVDNRGALDLSLDEDDVARIDGIERRERNVDPVHAPWNR